LFFIRFNRPIGVRYRRKKIPTPSIPHLSLLLFLSSLHNQLLAMKLTLLLCFLYIGKVAV
jgi:hypothetical protein